MLNSNLITIHQISFEAQVNKHLQTAFCQKVFSLSLSVMLTFQSSLLFSDFHEQTSKTLSLIC